MYTFDCLENERWYECGGMSPLCRQMCRPGCTCADGFVRISATNPTCIRQQECGK